MAMIGNPIISTDFPKDTFSGNGSTTAFTMSIAPASVNAVIVVVSGITQDPSTYTISGTTLTFSAAPPTGTSNISVRHLGVAGTPNTPSDASVTTAKLASLTTLPVNGGATLTLPTTTGNILSSTSQLVGKGTTTNDNASTSYVGEFVSSLVQGVTCGTSSSATSNLTSITLTAGDWDVSSLVTNYGAGNTVFGNFIATTNNANTNTGTRGLNLTWGLGNSTFGIGSCSIPRYRVSIASTTTYYLQTYGSGSSDQYDGYLAARRVR